MATGGTSADHGAPMGLGAEPGTIPLRIIATTDLHMHIFPWDYAADRAAPGRGLSSLAPQITAARDEVANALLFDNGDFLQGTALGDVAAQDFAAQEVGQTANLNPMIACMNALRYDAGTLGNHDVSHGLPYLMQALGQAAFPVVCANALTLPPAKGQALLLPWVVLDRMVRDTQGQTHPLRVGVIGMLPPQTTIWERGHLLGQVTVADIVATARIEIPRLRAAGADLVIVLAHSGIGLPDPEEDSENAALAVAALDGVDAVVMGHTHQRFPGPDFPTSDGVDPVRGTLAGKPAVMAGAYGSHLGIMDLRLRRDDNGRYRVVSHQAVLRPAAPDPAAQIQALAEPHHHRTLAVMRKRIGRVDQALSTYFALIAPCPALHLLAQAQARHVAAALQGGPYARLPVLSAVAPFRAGGRAGPDNFTDIPAGEMQLRHALDLYPHPNTITAVKITGADIADWLERAVGLFQQITPGAQDQALIDPAFPPFNFDLIHGLDFAIDLTQPSRFDPQGRLIAPDARRITGLTWRDAPIDASAPFIVATNGYRSNGGMGFAGASPSHVVHDDDLPVRDVLVRHVRDRGTRLPPTASGWRFIPMPGTTVTFLTGPRALAHRHHLPDLRLDAMGPTADGFLRFRLHL